MPRNKKYTVKDLRRSVSKYFDSISYPERAKKLVFSGEVDKRGNPIMVYEDVVNMDGEYITYREYALPPTMEGLCKYLGITRQALNKYKSDEKNGKKYADIIESARMEIEEYLHIRLNTKDKGQAGIQFDLQCNHGWGVADNGDTATEIVLDNTLMEWAK